MGWDGGTKRVFTWLCADASASLSTIMGGPVVNVGQCCRKKNCKGCDDWRTNPNDRDV